MLNQMLQFNIEFLNLLASKLLETPYIFFVGFFLLVYIGKVVKRLL